MVEALTEALSKIAAIQNLEDDESPLDDEELMADIRHVLCDLQDLCISCPVLYCQPCMNMKYAFSVLHYFITPRDVITEDVKRLALPRDPKMKLEERIAADRHDMATLMESWVLGSIYSLYSAVSTNEIGELPNSLPPRVVAAVVLYLVDDAEANYKKTWAIRSALRNGLCDHFEHLRNINTDHCAATTRSLCDPELTTSIFTEDSEQPSLSRLYPGQDNTRFAATLVVALANVADKLLNKPETRILLLSKVAGAKDGDFVAYRDASGEGVIGFVHGDSLIYSNPEDGGVSLFNAYLHYMPNGDAVRKAILEPSDDGHPISNFFLKYHTQE